MPAGGRAHDQRDLRDDPAGVHVALEDLAVEPERDHALLDARAAALVDADHRAAELHRQVEHLDDLLAVHLAEAAAEDRDVLAEHGHRAPVDRAVAGDHAVAVGPLLLLAEVGGPVPGQLVHLDEAALVEQHLDPLAGSLLALGVLLLDHAGRTRVHGLVVAPVQVGELAGRRVDVDELFVVGHGPQPSARRLPTVDGTAWGDLSRPPLRAGCAAPRADRRLRAVDQPGRASRPPDRRTPTWPRRSGRARRTTARYSPPTTSRPGADAGTGPGRRRRARRSRCPSSCARTAVPRALWSWLPLAVGLGVSDALVRFGGLDARLKWPNDVLVASRRSAACSPRWSSTPAARASWSASA